MPGIGEPLPPFRHVASPEAMKLWAKILKDPNPIHLDPAVVRAKGLGDRVINQGPANMAYVVNLLLQAFPDASVERLEVQFLDNVFGDETVVASGEVEAIEAGPDGERISCRVALAAGERTVLRGSATMLRR
jgi:acyl dehydratase